ncbi:hypothetical protein TRFO_40753 [Tritrichomonas foetus]|uniref:Uncharacterized protein n=1 Tax=Tritrichomonas foetus TaxID=1144522 RepID=A0A1J4J0H7_9EUKA|nr:hypothetical protein TRFO_40753 [Tritrichomonas foetus]|eukprot:OHS92914.1 hypothetical protein TRFO_40753 [Tritrichomonas foetus]
MYYKMTHMPVTHIYPRGTYSKKVYYARGDDIFKEPEYNEDEKRKLNAQYRAIKRDYDLTKKEYDEMTEKVNDTENYAITVSENLGDETNAANENATLISEIHELSRLIENNRNEMDDIRKKSNPTSINLLMKELATFLPEFEATAVDLRYSSEKIDLYRRSICEIMIKENYQDAVFTEAERKVSLRCKSEMTSKVKNIYKNINGAPSGKNSKRTSAMNEILQQKNSTKNSDILDLVDDLVESTLNLDEVKLQKELAANHKRTMIRAAIDEIAELNDMIHFLGGDIEKLEEIKEKVQFSKIVEEEKEIEEREKEEKAQRNDKPLSIIKKNRANVLTRPVTKSSLR